MIGLAIGNMQASAVGGIRSSACPREGIPSAYCMSSACATSQQVRVVELVNSREERDRLFAEIRVLKQLKHKNIMSFHESWLDQKTMCVNFITELFTSGTLRQ